MKKFNIFNKNRKDKDRISENIDESFTNNGLNDYNDTFGLKEDLDFYMIKNKNHETAEDAISIRSVDCKNKIKWNKRIVSFGNKSYNSKSLKHRNQSMSYHNLNIISEKGEIPSRMSSPKYQFFKSQDQKFNYDNLLKKITHIKNENIEINKLECEINKKQRDSESKLGGYDTSTQNLSKFNDAEQKRSESPLYGITTAAIIGRHDSTSSTHSICKQAWIETENGRRAGNNLNKQEIERQNIIHELLTGEIDSLNDLKGVIKHYKEPLEKLQLIASGDSFNIFYNIEKVIPVYETFVNLLEEERSHTGIIDSIGLAILQWSDLLDPIIKYCTHLYFSKAFLEEKRKDREIGEFLQRCSASKFSRKLDLWNFLDNPRSRLMKYPLLFERILKSTDCEHPDSFTLVDVLKKFEIILLTLDKKTGEEMCNFYLGKLDFLEQNQYINLVKNQNVLILEGNVKIGRSVHFHKVHAFLFEEILVFTKQSGEESIESTRYTVYGNPLPTNKLILENINDGEIKMGSFRSTFSSDKGSRNVFRLTLLSNFIPESEFEDSNREKNPEETFDNNEKYEQSSYDGRLLKNSQTILQTSQLEEKQLWLSTLRKVVAREIRREI